MNTLMEHFQKLVLDTTIDRVAQKMLDYYGVLQIKQDASDDDIKKVGSNSSIFRNTYALYCIFQQTKMQPMLSPYLHFLLRPTKFWRVNGIQTRTQTISPRPPEGSKKYRRPIRWQQLLLLCYQSQCIFSTIGINRKKVEVIGKKDNGSKIIFK